MMMIFGWLRNRCISSFLSAKMPSRAMYPNKRLQYREKGPAENISVPSELVVRRAMYRAVEAKNDQCNSSRF